MIVSWRECSHDEARRAQKNHTLSGLHFQAEDFTRLAFGNDLEGTAANLAIGRESLGGDAGVHRDFKSLSAIRTLDRFRNFHAPSLAPLRKRAKSRRVDSTGAAPHLWPANSWWGARAPASRPRRVEVERCRLVGSLAPPKCTSPHHWAAAEFGDLGARSIAPPGYASSPRGAMLRAPVR